MRHITSCLLSGLILIALSACADQNTSGNRNSQSTSNQRTSDQAEISGYQYSDIGATQGN